MDRVLATGYAKLSPERQHQVEMTVVMRLVSVLLACGLLIASRMPLVAADFRISHQWEAGKDARDAAARVFVAEVAKRLPSDKITIHPRLALGFEPERQYDAMLDGKVEMAIFPLFYLSPRIPELSITLLPGLPASPQKAQILKGTPFHKRLQDFAATKGIRILTWWWLEGGLVSTLPIDGPESVREMRIRSGDPIFDRMFQGLGADSVLMTSPGLPQALREGTVHAALASLESLVSLGIAKEAKHAVVGGHALYVSLHPLMMSLKAWNALPPASQAAFEAAADASDKVFVSSQVAAETEALAVLAKAGASVRQMPYDEYASWLEVANETAWKVYRETSPEAAELFMLMLRSFIESKP